MKAIFYSIVLICIAHTGFSQWSVTGNAGTSPSTNFLGTIDNQPLILRTNNTERIRLTEGGNLGIGITNPFALLDVNGLSRFRNSITVDMGVTNRSTQLRHDGVYMSRTTDGAFITSITGNGDMVLSARNDFKFMSNSASVFTIQENGKVGLGNVAPGARLSFPDVNIDTDPSGLTWYSPTPLSYAIYKTSGTWSAPDYQQLKLSWLTGLTIDPGTAYPKSYVDIQGSGLRVTGSSVGIGTTTPSAQLHTTGAVRFAGITNDNALTRVLVSDANGNLSYRDATTLGGGTAGWSFGGNAVAATSSIGTTSANDLQLITNGAERIRISAAGSVGIGTATINSSYKLFVEGAIRARKIKVDQAAWPDYVFDTSYSVISLPELEKFIKQNNHLPEIPTASEVSRNGIDLGDNQASLLKKIEELTLYLIGQNKKLETQEKQIRDLQMENKRIEQLEKAVEELKKIIQGK